MKLITAPNLPRPDAFYARLIDLHRDLDIEASSRVNARLILLLANHIGDPEIIEDAFRIASSEA